MPEAHMPTLHSVTFDAVPFLCALDGDRTTFVEFSRGFLADFPDALSSIYAAAEARDPDALGDRVHALRGSLAIFHAHPMLHELEAIERLCHTRPTAISVDLMRTLAVPADVFHKELTTLCDRLAANTGEAVELTTMEGN
jgi:HPt (histidine-containing phosphotransfer) domain-containing protein